MKIKTILWCVLFLLCLGCGENEDILNPAKGNHSIKLTNLFDHAGTSTDAILSLELDDVIVIRDVSYGSTKSYSGISSGRHSLLMLYEGPAVFIRSWKPWSQDFIGRETTLVIVVDSLGVINWHVEP